MKKFSSESRLGSSLSALLLVVGVLGVFFTLYNSITALGGEIPLLSILFVLLALIGITLMIGKLLALANALQAKRMDLEALAQTIEKSQQDHTEEQAVSEVAEKLDTTKEAQSLLPAEETQSFEEFAESLLAGIANKQEIVQGIMFLKDASTQEFSFAGGYAYYTEDSPPVFPEGETLPGQVAKNKEILNLDQLPPDYITILSGLGKGSPRYLLLIPILNTQKECIAVIELASFKPFTADQVEIYKKLSELVGERITAIANSIQE
jgi:hypothetical protein